MKQFNYPILQRKKKLYTIMMYIIFFCISSITLSAQTLKGRITTDAGKEIPGASILIKGTNIGTVANSNGEYIFNNLPKNATIVITSVGYIKQEIIVGTKTVIDVTLLTDNRELGEVIVVGYGTQKKRDITGSVVSVTEATLKEVPAPNLLNSLKGRAAGVSIVSNGSTPGSQASIRIRGNRSLTTGNGDGLDGPLVVVDGIPYGGLNDINPDDISNIEILKDASATAIYGSRGAGGVILVTTKRGKIGKPVLTYDGYHGITNIMGKYNVMNGEQYAKFKDLSAAYNTQGAGTTAYPLTDEEKANLAAGVSTDWQSLLYKQGFNTSHQLGLQGGVENTQYGMGIGYFNETGIMPNQNFDRATIRATLDQKIGKHVKIGLNTINTLTHKNDPAGGGIPTELVRLSPLVSAYNADGSVNLNPKKGTIEAQAVSPLTLISRGADILSNERSLRTFNSLYAEVNIIDGLKYRFNAGLNFSQVHFNGYSPPNTFVNTGTDQSVSSADIRNTEYWDVNLQHLLYYDKVFAQKHKIGLTALYEITKNHNLGSNFNVKGVPADYIQTANFTLASGAVTANTSFGNSFGETGLLSYMARLNYTFNDKYTLTATFRRDGSSTLSPGNQYFNYPAIGLSWNIIDEPFMKDLPVFSNLKLRGGWGISGNRNVDAYATLGALSSGYYNFGTTTAGQALAYTVTSLPASNLGWQSTSQSDFGLEIGLLNNRITGSFDVYKQNTKDILLSVNLPQSNGAGSALKNLGKTEGSGFESSLTFDIVRNKNGFNWSTDVTYFFNREKITQLTTPSELDNKGNFWFVGQPLTVIYDYNKIGIWQQSDKDNGTLAKQTSPVQVPGEIRVEDVDGNGKIDANDRKVIGNFQPKWEGGFTNRISFKGFDLSIVTYARMGMKVLVPYLAGTSGGGSGFGFLNQGRSNQLVMDYWTTENPTNAFPRPNAGGGVRDFTSTTQYQDGSFIKVRSINFGYTVPTKILSRLGISSARIYVNATNPLILYSPLVKDKLAIDPEGNGYGNTIQGGNFNRVISVNLNNPPVRQFTLGVNLKF
ncbi:TonB-linked SusC/RagA family outer membrane protein [Arcicella sp. BE140]|uniref:SusC/RagA family TonB-linked outer membrane protein n=2 Tax=Arcicella TaxID=217140 RepID=UPI0028637E16|nr:TonB-dependent receptor [Arcicella sp. BE140]MDR6562368.1 TonB-linked SusC/RagA family outer membrane protein [Arcicella sp. BE51]MDR6812262.1 TonB-linked SusC/RagA family outer membrane protein [Arcicella sp. BE140]MDR6823593.1 TonB-linked SusC/RagA family outer membrane protein [Arcicella sp. BE139]